MHREYPGYGEQSDRAAEVLGHLYALAAAHISGDRDAMRILLEDVPAEETSVMPEAAIAIAYTSVQKFRDGDDPFDDPLVSSIPPAMLGALTAVLEGDAPDFVELRGVDAVDAAVRTVGAIWTWAAYGEREEALRIARWHCANMVLYRARGTRGGWTHGEDDEGWN
jgi:hypothetical protein